MQTKSDTNLMGIDVSHYQGTINWKEVAAAGVKYAIIKATDGNRFVDPKLSVNASGAIAAGIPIAFYHYARPDRGNTPEVEAAHFAKHIKPFKTTFPNVLDVEGDAAALGAAKLTDWCVKFLKELQRLTGRDVMLYTGASFARSYLKIALSSCPLWVAHYNDKIMKPLTNTTWNAWAIWQHTDKGKVRGIAGNVDVNRMDKSFYDRYVKPPAKEEPTMNNDKKIKAMEEEISNLKKEIEELKRSKPSDNTDITTKLTALYNRMRVEQIPTWAKDAVDKLVKAEILNGVDDISYDILRVLTLMDRMGMLPVEKKK